MCLCCVMLDSSFLCAKPVSSDPCCIRHHKFYRSTLTLGSILLAIICYQTTQVVIWIKKELITLSLLAAVLKFILAVTNLVNYVHIKPLKGTAVERLPITENMLKWTDFSHKSRDINTWLGLRALPR